MLISMTALSAAPKAPLLALDPGCVVPSMVTGTVIAGSAERGEIV